MPEELQAIDLSGLHRGVPHTVGRKAPTAVIVIPETSVSKQHASLRISDNGSVELKDKESKYGTFVNNQRIVSKVLNEGDSIRFGHRAQFRFSGLLLRPSLESIGMELSISGMAVDAGTTRILSGVDLQIKSDEFVGIIGPSGCGKSTLLAAFTGVYPEACDSITFDQDHPHAQKLRQFLDATGVVPQKDLLFDELTVRENLEFSLRIKQPAWKSEMVRDTVTEAIRQVDLQEHEGKRVSVLSGGQRKRANVAMELTTRPRLLLLDEPTSGLDPDLEERMLDRLKALSRRGMTVIVVAHTTNWHLFDTLVVLQPHLGGTRSSIAYCGPPNAYKGLLAADEERPSPSMEAAARLHSRTRRQKRPARQFEDGEVLALQRNTIFRRSWLCLWRDRFSLILSFLLPCLTSAMIVLSQKQQGTPAQTTFFLVIASYWFGMTAAVKEMLSERKLYSRDRLAGLDPDAYFLGKGLFASSIALLQWAGLLVSAIVTTALIHQATIGIGLHTAVAKMSFLSVAAASIAVLVSGVGGAFTGLIVSALSRTERMAVTALPIILLPQILFSRVAYGTADAPPVEPPFGMVSFPPDEGFLDWLLYASSLPFVTRPASMSAALCFDGNVTRSEKMFEVLFLTLLFILYGVAAWLLFRSSETKWNDWR